MSITSRLAYHYLRALPAEAAHNVGTWAIKHELMGEALPPYKPVKLFGKQLANGLGLAAGFDKSAKLLRHLSFYGFGFIEVGSVTFRGGKGNPKPRMFRLGDDLMNRMGLPGDSAEVVAQRLADAPLDDNFGVNIAKTHDPDCVGDAAIDDVVDCYRLVGKYGIYTALNISCPNTAEGKTFEEPAALADLFAALKPNRLDDAPPLVVKLSPRQPGAELDAIAEVCLDAGVDGFVCANTMPVDHPKHGKGGQSGSAVRPIALEMVRHLAKTGKTIIGCGGVFRHEHFDAYIDAGATAAQAYNGFVRGPKAGPKFAWSVIKR